MYTKGSVKVKTDYDPVSRRPSAWTINWPRFPYPRGRHVGDGSLVGLPDGLLVSFRLHQPEQVEPGVIVAGVGLQLLKHNTAQQE